MYDNVTFESPKVTLRIQLLLVHAEQLLKQRGRELESVTVEIQTVREPRGPTQVYQTGGC